MIRKDLASAKSLDAGRSLSRSYLESRKRYTLSIPEKRARVLHSGSFKESTYQLTFNELSLLPDLHQQLSHKANKPRLRDEPV